MTTQKLKEEARLFNDMCIKTKYSKVSKDFSNASKLNFEKFIFSHLQKNNNYPIKPKSDSVLFDANIEAPFLKEKKFNAEKFKNYLNKLDIDEQEKIKLRVEKKKKYHTTDKTLRNLKLKEKVKSMLEKVSSQHYYPNYNYILKNGPAYRFPKRNRNMDRINISDISYINNNSRIISRKLSRSVDSGLNNPSFLNKNINNSINEENKLLNKEKNNDSNKDSVLFSNISNHNNDMTHKKSRSNHSCSYINQLKFETKDSNLPFIPLQKYSSVDGNNENIDDLNSTNSLKINSSLSNINNNNIRSRNNSISLKEDPTYVQQNRNNISFTSNKNKLNKKYFNNTSSEAVLNSNKKGKKNFWQNRQNENKEKVNEVYAGHVPCVGTYKPNYNAIMKLNPSFSFGSELASEFEQKKFLLHKFAANGKFQSKEFQIIKVPEVKEVVKDKFCSL